MLDFILALLINIKGIFAFLFWVSLIASIVILIVGGFMKGDDSARPDEDDWFMWRRFQKYAVICVLITGPFYALPNMDDLWHVRINMLKFHAVSPANIEKFAKHGMPHIERVAKKMECKYLGCPDSEKKVLGIEDKPATSSTSKDITEKVVEKVATKIVEEVTK